jgi:flavin-dependent dehydrogenase
MRIGVLGGGTAGFIAAAHLTHRFSEAEFLHVFDSRLPTIGVGEGTTPRFPLWFHQVTGLGFPELAERCQATLKKGTFFEGWGSNGTDFFNRFQPARLIGYHFDAALVVKVLAEHVRATILDARVTEVRSGRDGVELRLADGTVHLCDYLLDASGFPCRGSAAADTPLVQLDWVPTGQAVLRWLPPVAVPFEHTRAIARPHGWIFQIPLRDRVSCGYIHNARISSQAEVEADFDALLAAEGVAEFEPRGMISFPNFVCRRWFDGRVFRIGNAASFLEPLEATAIGAAIVQVRKATRWIEENGPSGNFDTREIEACNRTILDFVCRNSLFIAWHYARGSRWNTPFWEYARRGIERAGRSELAGGLLPEMESFIHAGASVPGLAIPEIEEEGRWKREVFPLLKVFRPFGNFSELNFAQVGHGIGYYGPGEADPPVGDRVLAPSRPRGGGRSR